ncbi:MAG: enoyl-CoA hydratase/isomerase family protein [Microbacteriaceae bacterium]
MGRPDYFDKYDTWNFERSDDGVLVMRIHTNGGPADYGSKMHSEWAPAFSDVSRDLDNRVVIVTGTGDSFIAKHGKWLEPLENARDFEVVSYRHTKMFESILSIDVPVIGVANGPVNHHSELLVMSDIVLAADTTVFGDGHFPAGEPAADGGHIFWLELLGQNRGKYFLLTGHKITANEARDIGFVNEVWPMEDLMPRALELAHQMATYADLSLRFQRRAFVDRWRRLFRENIGVGYGMALENLAHLGRQFNVWTGTHEGSEDYAKLQRPMAKKPGGLYGYGD